MSTLFGGNLYKKRTMQERKPAPKVNGGKRAPAGDPIANLRAKKKSSKPILYPGPKKRPLKENPTRGAGGRSWARRCLELEKGGVGSRKWFCLEKAKVLREDGIGEDQSQGVDHRNKEVLDEHCRIYYEKKLRGGRVPMGR